MAIGVWGGPAAKKTPSSGQASVERKRIEADHPRRGQGAWYKGPKRKKLRPGPVLKIPKSRIEGPKLNFGRQGAKVKVRGGSH